jgi:hypothetical protein
MSEGSEKKLALASEAAAEIVAAGARRLVPTMSGDARRSLKAAGGQITAGGRQAPYFGWLDFGGKTPRGAVRPFVRSGRYIYPTLAKNDREIQDGLSAKLADLATDAGLDVT